MNDYWNPQLYDLFSGTDGLQAWCGIDRCWYDMGHKCKRWKPTEWYSIDDMPTREELAEKKRMVEREIESLYR